MVCGEGFVVAVARRVKAVVVVAAAAVVAVAVAEICWVRATRTYLRMTKLADLEGGSRWRRGDRNCRYAQTETKSKESPKPFELNSFTASSFF